MAAHLLSVVCQMFFVKPSLEKRPSVYARGRMRLKEHEVPAGPFSASSKKMIEAHFKYFRGRGVARDVTTEFAIGLVGSDYHCKRIPGRPNMVELRRERLYGAIALRVRRAKTKRDRYPLR